MRRRYVLALVLATALIFTLGGVAVGHYVVRRSKDDTGQCQLFQGRINDGFKGNFTSDQIKATIDYFNANCR